MTTEEEEFEERIRRTPDRAVYLIDVGEASEAEALAIVDRWRKRWKQNDG